MMRRIGVALWLAAAALAARAESYVVFDVPGATSHGLIRLNAGGDVSGIWVDAAGTTRAFVRHAAGTIDSYQVPGASSTEPLAIGDSGVVVGRWLADANSSYRGFIRLPDGQLQVYDAPGATWTQLRAVNGAGDIAGNASGDAGAYGFVLKADGSLVKISGVPTAINAQGEVAGNANGGGFVRTADGTFTPFSIPGLEAGATVSVRSISADRTVTGSTQLATCTAGGRFCTVTDERGFVRTPDGTVTRFAVKRGSRDVQTAAFAVNAGGVVAGTSSLVNGRGSRAFLRAPDGALGEYLVPGMVDSTATSLNDAGAVAGTAADATVRHGYVRLP